MRNVMVNHRRTAWASPRSARNTPIWQVTDEASRISVNGSAYQTLRLGLCSTHSSGAAARMEKNIANRPAKNNSSLESHTIVPTATMVGRFSERTGLTIPGAAVTRSLWLPLATRGRRGRELAAAGGTRTPFPVPGTCRPGQPVRWRLAFHPARTPAPQVRLTTSATDATARRHGGGSEYHGRESLTVLLSTDRPEIREQM